MDCKQHICEDHNTSVLLCVTTDRKRRKSMMKGHGVIVKYSQLVDGTRKDISCSGMYLGHGIVLTHGTLLVDFFQDKRAEPVIQELSAKGYCSNMKQQHDILNSIFKAVQAEFKIILPSKQCVREAVDINCDPCSSAIESPSKMYPQNQINIQSHDKYLVPQTGSDSFISVTADVNRIFLQCGIQECMASLMPASQGWQLLEENQSCIPPTLEKIIVASFVLLTVSKNGFGWVSEETGSIVIEAVKEIFSSSVPIQKGNFVYIESSPFGSASPNIFLNSLSHGIICNTCSKGKEVLLTDARCITGSEGAPVFAVVNGKRRLCALVISPFCWREGEWLGLTLLASLGPVLQTLLQSYNSTLSEPKNILTQNKNLLHPITGTAAASEHEPRSVLKDKNFLGGSLEDVSRSVVCIRSGEGWGSGLVISTSPGVILTCAHVTYKATNKKVTVLLSDGRKVQGTVIHQTCPLITSKEGPRPPPARYSMWDLSVVVTSFPLPHALPLATSLPPQGSGIVVAGYGMFPPWILLSPTLSRGVISKVVTLPSSSLHLPPCLHGSGYSEGYIHGANVNTVATQHNFSVKRDPKIVGKTLHGMKNLVTPQAGSFDKCVSVPIVMQTTCAVYAGGSGGPVVAIHPSQGLQVVGLVVCNMQDSNGITFPHVNLAIPIPTIATILNAYLKTKDETMLKYLDVECTAASRLWGLTHPSRSCL